MRLIYSPSRLDIHCSYAWEGECLTVSLDGDTDTFDFSGLPDGATEGIDSSLGHNPVLRAERVAGELTVHLLHWYGPEPQPIEGVDYEAALAAWELEKTVREVIL